MTEVTDEMVDKAGKQVDDLGWLPEGWRPVCPCCHRLSNDDDDTVGAVRSILEAALND